MRNDSSGRQGRSVQGLSLKHRDEVVLRKVQDLEAGIYETRWREAAGDGLGVCCSYCSRDESRSHRPIPSAAVRDSRQTRGVAGFHEMPMYRMDSKRFRTES
jgi:hypothetical protein